MHHKYCPKGNRKVDRVRRYALRALRSFNDHNFRACMRDLGDVANGREPHRLYVAPCDLSPAEAQKAIEAIRESRLFRQVKANKWRYRNLIRRTP